MERLKLVKRNKIYEGKEKLLKKAKEMINICRKLHIKIITIDCDNYPQVLKNIYMPPLVLYYRGTLPLLNTKKALL